MNSANSTTTYRIITVSGAKHDVEAINASHARRVAKRMGIRVYSVTRMG
jgi:hypothetical protein